LKGKRKNLAEGREEQSYNFPRKGERERGGRERPAVMVCLRKGKGGGLPHSIKKKKKSMIRLLK